ncbi:MAG: flavodoxin family protein [Dehalococcoidales bacterium]|nr:flavodoxin family protein [Dehalococcoidales bacterium]
MKVLGIVCSPRKGGNTEILMQVALDAAQKLGAETELWTASGKDLKPCDGCESCRRKGGVCRIQDDMTGLYPKILAADGIIFGSPAYFMSVTAQAKIIIDRIHALYTHYLLANKVAGIIAVANSRGHEGVLQGFSNLFRSCHIIQADLATGWAQEKGEVRKDDFGMKNAEELGKQMVALINQKPCWPEEYRRPIHRIVKEDYGIDPFPLRHTRQKKSE